MLKMKKIVGILLALCFVLSVTAATAAASGDSHRDGPGDHGKPKFDDRHKPKFNDHYKPKFNDHHKPKFNDHHKKRHFHPGHWEKHKVPHKKFINHKYVYVYVYESVFVQGYWGFN